MKKAGYYSRRSVLGGLAASAGLIPLLSGNRVFGADASTAPRRLLIVAQPNGVVRPEFWPKGGNGKDLATMTFPQISKPLEPYRSDLVFMKGLVAQHYSDTKGAAFHCGHAVHSILFTGTKGKAISAQSKYVDAASKTIDQAIADDIARRVTLPFHSLNLAMLRASGSVGDACFFRDAGSPIIGEVNPMRVVENFFKGLTSNNTVNLNRLRAERRSVLDFVGADIARFTARLGTEDRLKVNTHLESVRKIEKETAALADVNCAVPTLPNMGTDPQAYARNTNNFPALLKAQMDLITAAFKCDLTRVATLMVANNGGGSTRFPWLGFGEWHRIAHEADGPTGVEVGIGTAGPGRKIGIDTWFMQQFAQLIKQFKETPEFGGTMLDNTIILFTNSMGDGKAHDWSDLPFFIAGSGGKYFKTGQLLNFTPRRALNPLYVSIANAMGVPIRTFGDPLYGSGPLPGLQS